MDTAFLQAIVDDDYTIPEDHSISELTSKLTVYLGSPNSDLRENSLAILWEWAERGYYSDGTLRELGMQMARNLTVGIGENGTDTVFLRAFSVLILSAVVTSDEMYAAGEVEGRSAFLEQAYVRDWLDQGLNYLKDEQDLRGYVSEEGKGWAHAIAHTADLLGSLARSHHLGVADLERILDGIADKIAAPADRVYHYEEGERLVSAVMAVLLRDAVGIPFLSGWLDRLAHPPDQAPWHQVSADERANNAKNNSKAFLRSLYFQLLIGMRNYYPTSYYDGSPAIKDDLLPCIVKALRDLDHRRFYPEEKGNESL